MNRLDFDSIMGQVTTFKQGLRSVQGQITQPKQKAILQQLIDKIDETHEEVLGTVPATLKTLEEKKNAVQAKVDQIKAQAEQQKAEGERLVTRAQEEAAKFKASKAILKVKPQALPLSEVDPKLPERMRLELLEKYGSLREIAQTPTPHEAEIWEDWQAKAAEIREQNEQS